MTTSFSTSTPDLVACTLRLVALAGATLERTQGHRVHALFLELVRQSDPALAALLHADAPVKPFTVTPLDTNSRRVVAGDDYLVRLALLRGDLYHPFASVFLRGTPPELHVGTARFALRELRTTTEGHPWAGLASWEQLLGDARPAEMITLEFATPTAFTRAGRGFGLFPEPGAVFGSLLRRWNALAPTPLPADLLDKVELLPSRYELRTSMLQLGKSPQLGFVGRCAYQVRGPEVERRLVATLADAAFFLGVGYKTTQGMGLARRVQEAR